MGLLTRFARLSFVLRVLRVLEDAFWVSTEPYSGAPAKPTRVPFFIAATNKVVALPPHFSPFFSFFASKEQFCLFLEFF